VNYDVTEADIIVVGAGGAGLTAAKAASDKGASVIILEKSGVIGGNSLCSQMGINAADSKVQEGLGMEFATAAFHNSYYFHKDDNQITNREEVCSNFEKLVNLQLKENSPKSWFRAWFNMGLINYIEGSRRMLPCEAGSANFFIDPWGEVYPCNGLEEKYWKQSMGNIHKADFMTIWQSEEAQEVRRKVRCCAKNCWMVGTASPVMHKYIKYPLQWALRNKLRSLQGKPACLDKKWCDVGQDPRQGDLNPNRS
jgi:radical SAM protein with 4Fe4S-binding SPASM domain